MTLTFRANFAYNEPRFGEISIEGPDVKEEDILKLIEEEFPHALDVEILDIEEDIN
jgi:hypothetical protein